MTITVPAHAKINLGLRVLSQRPDGYHEIETVFHKVALQDTISIDLNDDIIVDSDDPAAPGDATNICHRATRMLSEELNVPVGARITLRKKIPVGAGLGGGSSDAATVLKALPELWGVPSDEGLLHRIALKLGSDVPFFLGGPTAYARGRGEVLKEIDLTIPYAILLCNPGIPISTAWAYSQIRSQISIGPPVLDILTRNLRAPDILQERLINDFEAAIFPHYPALRQLKDTLRQQGAVFAAMSGSGSTIFGFFEEMENAAKSSEMLRRHGMNAWVTPPYFIAN